MTKVERLEAVESAIYALEDAIRAVKTLGEDHTSDQECLSSMMGEMQEEYSAIHAEIEAADAANDAAMEREYWRAVI